MKYAMDVKVNLKPIFSNLVQQTGGRPVPRRAYGRGHAWNLSAGAGKEQFKNLVPGITEQPGSDPL